MCQKKTDFCGLTVCIGSVWNGLYRTVSTHKWSILLIFCNGIISRKRHVYFVKQWKRLCFEIAFSWAVVLYRAQHYFIPKRENVILEAVQGEQNRENTNFHLNKSVITICVFGDPWLSESSSAAVSLVKHKVLEGNTKLQWGFLRHSFGTEEMHFVDWFMSWKIQHKEAKNPEVVQQGGGAIGAAQVWDVIISFISQLCLPLVYWVDVWWLNQQETGGSPDLGKRELHVFMCCSFSKDGVTLSSSSS